MSTHTDGALSMMEQISAGNMANAKAQAIEIESLRAQRAELLAALQVLTLTPAILKFLQQVDPKALAQANAAIHKATQ